MNTLTAKDIMTPCPVTCTANSSIDRVAKVMLAYNCGVVPIVDDTDEQRIIGIVTDRDIVCRSTLHGVDPRLAVIAECMSYPVLTISPDTSVEDCCGVMKSAGVRRLPVVNATGVLCGIVSLKDIIAHGKILLAAEVLRAFSLSPATPSRSTLQVTIQL